MSFDERLVTFLLGCLVGLILGYLGRMLQDIKEKVDDVDNIVRKGRDEGGFVRNPIALDIVLLLLVALTVYSSVASQFASNKSNKTSDRVITIQQELRQNQNCDTQVLFDSLQALGNRTTYSGSQIDANVAAWQAQLELLTKSRDPSLSRQDQLALYNEYIKQVQNFVDISKKTKNSQDQNPVPTPEDLTVCLSTKPSTDSPEPSESNSPTPSSSSTK